MPSNTVARAAFTRQHYVAVADAISGGESSCKCVCSKRERQLIIDALSALFAEDNSRFNADKFSAACEVTA
jgi:hypothetical protein